jgi:BCD family chlorophyll transporter-like MFS transporter
MDSAALFRAGTVLIGFGGGLFAVGTLTSAMDIDHGQAGLALGAWGAVQALAAGIAIALGGAVHDVVASIGATGVFGPALAGPAAGYGAVYHLELLLLFATLIVIGPLVRHAPAVRPHPPTSFGLAEFPG